MLKSKLVWLISGGAVAVATVVTAVVLLSGNNKYLSAIPEDALAVVRIDPVSFFKAAETTPNDIMERLDITPEELKEKMDMEDVDIELENVGIDWSEPAYMFVTKDKLTAMTFAVSDKDNLTETFKKLEDENSALEVTEQKEYMLVSEHDNPLIAYNDDALVFLTLMPGRYDASDNKRFLRKCLDRVNDGEDYSPIVKNMEDEEAILAAYVDFGVALDEMSDSEKEKMEKALRESPMKGIKVEKLGFYSSIVAEDNKLVWSAKLETTDENTREKLDKLYEKAPTISGELNKSIPTSALLWGMANADMKEFVKGFEKAGLEMDDFQRHFGVDLRSIEGEVAFAGGYKKGEKLPWAVLFGKTKGTFFTDADKFAQNFGSHYGAIEDGSNQYQLGKRPYSSYDNYDYYGYGYGYDDYDYGYADSVAYSSPADPELEVSNEGAFGTKKGVSYFSFPNYNKDIFSSNSNKLVQTAGDDLKNYIAYFSFDVKKACDLLVEELKDKGSRSEREEIVPAVKFFGESISAANAYVAKDGRIVLEVVSATSDSPLKVLVDKFIEEYKDKI